MTDYSGGNQGTWQMRLPPSREEVRDDFAKAVMLALVDGVAKGNVIAIKGYEEIAEAAYRMADAMMAEREKKA